MAEAKQQTGKSPQVMRQGVLLFSGFATAQALSFIRNALIGHGLSKGDFGIAATITLILQLVETLSDLGSDRLIIQAKDGDEPHFVATAHSVLVARGLFIAVLLFLTAPLATDFFGLAYATDAFRWTAAVPLIKAFMHLDCRVAQRRLDNRPQMLVETLPQAVALSLTLPVLACTGNYTAVVWISLAQASAMTLISHVLARTPYRLDADDDVIRRQIAFGWPILLSALPLVAVYQGDRMIVGKLFGMEALASYTTAFMATMVPGLIAAKVGHALMLPLFSDALRKGRSLRSPLALTSEVTALAAALFLAGFLVAGDSVVAIVFGPGYRGLAVITGWLALMWSLRMAQAVAGMALMANGETKPFLWAGLVRAMALPFALAAALQGASIADIAAIGAAAEACSLIYVAVRMERVEKGLGLILASRTTFLIPAALAALLTRAAAQGSPMWVVVMTLALLPAVAGIGCSVMPALRARIRQSLFAGAPVSSPA